MGEVSKKELESESEFVVEGKDSEDPKEILALYRRLTPMEPQAQIERQVSELTTQEAITLLAYQMAHLSAAVQRLNAKLSGKEVMSMTLDEAVKKMDVKEN